MLSNVFASPRTTLAGLWAAIMAPLGMYVVPAAAQYLGAQPSIGWQGIGFLLGLVVPALMRDAPKPSAAALSSVR